MEKFLERPLPSGVSRHKKLALLLGALGVMLLIPVAGVMGHVHLNRSGFPDLEPFLRFELPRTGRVLDAQGAVLIEVAGEYRDIISYDQLPPMLRQAILATEDQGFFRHRGIDYRALPRVVRASVRATTSGWLAKDRPFQIRFPQGGSTITQQLVRGYFLSARTQVEGGTELYAGQMKPSVGPRFVSLFLGVPVTNKLFRKVEEARLALWLEREMTQQFGSRELAKHEILSRYASYLYLGNGRYGYAAASEFYFGIPLSQLTEPGLAALLAGIGKSPHHYAPVDGNSEPLRRRNEILVLMAGHGDISALEAKQATAEPIRVADRQTLKTGAPAVIQAVFAELEAEGRGRFGVSDLFLGRLNVRTTVDGRIQAIATEALEAGLETYEARHRGGRSDSQGDVQGSVVVLRNHDGAVLAMVGGRRQYRGIEGRYTDFNRATESFRQPGSAWKPIVYLAAFRVGPGLDCIVMDAPVEVRDGSGTKWIANYDGTFKGPMEARQALAESRNTAAVRMARSAGYAQVRDVARELGITSDIELHESLALGAADVRLVELANAFRAIASGIRARPHIIDEIVAASGAVMFRPLGALGPVAPPGLREIQEGLRGVVQMPGGTAHSLASAGFPIQVMGKTGTTNGFRDALFIGSTWGPEGITVAVRIGYDDNRSLGNGETGSRAALPVFREIMLQTYGNGQAGEAPTFPAEMERSISTHEAARFIAPVPDSVPVVLNPSLVQHEDAPERPFVRALGGASLIGCDTGPRPRR